MEVPGSSDNGCSAKSTQVQDGQGQDQVPISPNPSPTMQGTQDNLEELQVCGNDQGNNVPSSSQVPLCFDFNCTAAENHRHPWGLNQSPFTGVFSMQIVESCKNIVESMENKLVQAEKLLTGNDSALKQLEPFRQTQQLVIQFQRQTFSVLEKIDEAERMLVPSGELLRQAESLIAAMGKAVSDAEKKQIEIKDVLVREFGVDVPNLGNAKQFQKMEQMGEEEQVEMLDAEMAEVSPELDPPPTLNVGKGENERKAE